MGYGIWITYGPCTHITFYPQVAVLKGNQSLEDCRPTLRNARGKQDCTWEEPEAMTDGKHAQVKSNLLQENTAQ